MKYIVCCRFILSVSATFILNVNVSFAHIPNYLCFSLIKDTIKNRYIFTGVKQLSNGLWAMPKNNLFEIVDETGKNGVFIKTAGKYQNECKERMYTCFCRRKRGCQCSYACRKFRTAWTAHIVATQASRGEGLSVQGCGAASVPFRHMNYLPCCQLRIADKK